jgi:thiol-disulfide isomerase/thioredoxin
VIVIIAVLVLVKVLGGSSSNSSYTPVTPASASVVKDVTSIPASVYNAVGVTSSTSQLAPPTVLSNQPALTLGGKTPAMLYFGAEWCPYCAAERWGIVTALARFGTWSGLKVTASSHTDVYPATPTFTFAGATYTSPYLTFDPIENCTNVPDAADTSCNGYKSLQSPNKQEQAAITKYSSPTYLSGATAGEVSYPFIDIDNQALISGASYNPGILTGSTHQSIAAGLKDASNPITQAIVGTANYISAAICAGTKQQPSSVCASSGVQAADKAMKSS